MCSVHSKPGSGINSTLLLWSNRGRRIKLIKIVKSLKLHAGHAYFEQLQAKEGATR